MDQVKIGRFIAQCRKNQNMTQLELAQKLNITDRAISKWENGRSMPDSAIMLDLCKELNISVNDLLHAEVIDMKDYKEYSEQLLIEMTKQKEKSDKQMLNLEIVIGVLSALLLFTLVFVASLVQMENWLRITLIVFGFIVFCISMAFALKIEQVAGYYECKECHHKYVPSFSQVLWSAHVNRTRYMRCPKCNKKSWQKKVISKD